MSYTTEIQVRFSDTDAYGHVNNATFFTYMETARFHYLRDEFVGLMDRGVVFLVAKAECEYKSPINLADRVFITIDVERIGNSSFTLLYKMHDGNDKLFATGRTVLVAFDTGQGKPVKIPEEFLKVLKKQG